MAIPRTAPAALKAAREELSAVEARAGFKFWWMPGNSNPGSPFNQVDVGGCLPGNSIKLEERLFSQVLDELLEAARQLLRWPTDINPILYGPTETKPLGQKQSLLRVSQHEPHDGHVVGTLDDGLLDRGLADPG
jgi:hypothetical protein